MAIAVLGIDLGKNSCSIVGLNGTGEVVLRRRMRGDTLVNLASSLPPCMIAMGPAAGLIIWGVCSRLRATASG